MLFSKSFQPHLATNGESQPRFSVTGTVYNQAQLDKMYEVYGQHRLSGRSQSWPNGLNYQVSWNAQTHTLIDLNNATSTQQCIWANGCTFQRYVLGRSGVWRGVPFAAPLVGAPTFHSESVSTDAGRPGTFDGQACNTPGTGWPAAFNGWMCESAYEAAWGNYLSQLVTWLTANVPDFANSLHGVWYTINEPQVS